MMLKRLTYALLLLVLMMTGGTAIAQSDSVQKAANLIQIALTAPKNIDKEIVIGSDAGSIERKYGKPESITTTVLKDKTLDQWVYNNGYVYVENGKVDSYQITPPKKPVVEKPELLIRQSLEIIDKAIKDPSMEKSAYAWYIRGFIYKEWYKAFESRNKKAKSRLDALTFFKTSLALDTAKEYVNESKKNIKWIGFQFYNDAGTLLDPANYQTAIENYEKFKECMLIAEPTYNLKVREIEFKNALATVYTHLFRADLKGNLKFYGMTEELYKQVLALDTNNVSANYNLAMLYYNYGVDIINQMPIDAPLIDIENIQEEAKLQFKKALPFALKAHQQDPKRKDPIIALQGIYFSLYEFEKSDEFKAKLDAIEKGK